MKRTSLFALLGRLLQRFGNHHLKPRLTELAGAKTLPQGELPQQHPASSSRPRFALVILAQLMDWQHPHLEGERGGKGLGGLPFVEMRRWDREE